MKANKTIAINILLLPGEPLLTLAKQENDRFKNNFPEGFAFDETHAAHITILQCFVSINCLDEIAQQLKDLTHYLPKKLEATGFHGHSNGAKAVGSVVVKNSTAMTHLQLKVQETLAQFVLPSGNADAFYRQAGEAEIIPSIIKYVSTFRKKNTGKHFEPHLTIGLAKKAFVEKLCNAPFAAFDFSVDGLAVFQLGNHGTARRKLFSF